MMRRIVALVAAVLLASPLSEAKKGDPIMRVVELIQELKAKVEADGKTEQKLYDKYACWCEKTLARKAAAIDAAKETIEKTQNEIYELKGKLGELGATIKQLEKEVAENEEERKEATEIRNKENEDYMSEKLESEQCIGAMEAAIKVLSGAGTKQAALLGNVEEAQLLSVVAGVEGVVKRMPESHPVSDDDLKVVRTFISDPVKFVKGGFVGAQVSSENPHGDYAPASTQITGILKGMYDGFMGNLEKANAEEADKQKSFEELMATKMAEFEAMSATLEAKTKANAEAKKKLADDEVLLEETKTQLAADEKFFAETTVACKEKAAEWNERSRLRTEELMGMNKAVEILSSDDAKASFAGSQSTFVQLSSVTSARESEEARQRASAYFSLKKVVRKTHGNLRLALLAAEVRTSGHFDKVIVQIDQMIADLRVEEQEDIKKRDQCENEENRLTSQAENLDYEIQKTGDLIGRLESKSAELEQKIAEKQGEMDQVNETMGEMLATRNQETEEFKKALKDDVDAAGLIGEAIQALVAFYTNNKLPLELVQEDPKYTVDEDKAPETFGEGGYGGRKSESKGIIGIMEMLKEDLEKEIKVAREEEAAAQKEYEEQLADLTATMNALKETKTTLEDEKADTDGKIADSQAEKANKEDAKESTEGEMDALKPSCDWVKNTFDSRREKRKAEIQGLQEAKSYLAGATPGGEEAFFQSDDLSAFLQRKA